MTFTFVFTRGFNNGLLGSGSLLNSGLGFNGGLGGLGYVKLGGNALSLAIYFFNERGRIHAHPSIC